MQAVLNINASHTDDKAFIRQSSGHMGATSFWEGFEAEKYELRSYQVVAP
jgi:hypothetical protein